MRVAGDIAYLLPVGGIEIVMLEDTTALTARGHQVDLFFGLEGDQRRLFEAAGVGLHGPVSYKLTRRRPLQDLLGFLPTVMAGPDAWVGDDTIARSIEVQQGEVRNPAILEFQNRLSERPYEVQPR